MHNSIAIKPKTVLLDTVEIKLFHYTLNTSAIFDVLLFDTEKQPIKFHKVEITGDEFNAWGSDDSYIENLILSKLDLEKA